MIGISALYCGVEERSHSLRYGPRSGHGASAIGAPTDRRPVVVWSCTRRCNLRCRHCYSQSGEEPGGRELSIGEGLALLDDLAAFGVPVVLFSGGEPLLRPDILDMIRHATSIGLRAVLSTNGTLIDAATAAALKQAGLTYAGVSLDGVGRINDQFRGVDGAFTRAVAGIRECRAAGLKVGLRFTITRSTVSHVADLFELAQREGVARLCFYHLVYAGRGSRLIAEDLDHPTARGVVDQIIDATATLHASGYPLEVLTVDNHADGPWLSLRLRREGNPRAEAVEQLLRRNGGSASGVRIGCINWDGSVHPDQFWRHASVGNVTERPFSAIWSDAAQPLLAQLRDKNSRLTGRCARCRFLDMCGGSSRVRAEAATGDLWAPDPACYLTDAEISHA